MWHVWKVILIPYFTVTPFHCFFHHHSVTCTHFLSLSFPLLSPPALPHSPGYSGHPHLPSPPTPASRVHYLLPPAPPAIHSVPHLLPPPSLPTCLLLYLYLHLSLLSLTSMPRRIEAVIKAKGFPTNYWRLTYRFESTIFWLIWCDPNLFLFFSSKNWEVNGDFFTVF